MSSKDSQKTLDQIIHNIEYQEYNKDELETLLEACQVELDLLEDNPGEGCDFDEDLEEDLEE